MTAYLTCDRIRPLLSAYHDDALSHAERVRVREHIAACANCRSTLEMYDRVYAVVRAIPAPAVPFELRYNVYSQIATIEAGRGWRSPFRPAFGRTMRATGSTAGVLAVLGALVLAALRLGSDANHSPSPAVAFANPTTLGAWLTTMQHGRGVSSMPAAEQTAVAPLHAALMSGVGATMIITGAQRQARSSRVMGLVIQNGANGQPYRNIPVHVDIALKNGTPVASSVVLGTPSPVPTIPGDAGFVYLGFDKPDALVNAGNSRAYLGYHSVVSSGQSVVLATPVADSDPDGQIFTGLVSNPADGSIYFSAKGREHGGIYRLDPTTLRATQVISLADRAAGYDYRYDVVQLHRPGGPNPLTFVSVNERFGAAHVSIEDVNPNASSPQTVVRILNAAYDPWFDYVLSPDQRRLAWVDKPARLSGDGMLKVSSFGAATAPTTITIGPGAHPEWSSDSQDVLYHDARQTALYLWGPGIATPRQVAVVNPALLRSGAYISSFAWAPGNRYIVYVISTTEGPGATSRVYLADVTTGVSWPVFQHRWIGAIAWAREPQALRASVATPLAAPTAPPTAVSLTTRTTGTASTIGAASTSGAAAVPTSAAAAVAPHIVVDNGDSSPTETLLSYYRALNRQEFARAFGLIATVDQRNFAHFKRGFGDTAHDTILVLNQAPYLNASNYHATTCLAFHMEARHTDGKVFEFGGWYVLQSTTGQNPTFGGWRIALSRSHIRQNLPATLPAQARCG